MIGSINTLEALCMEMQQAVLSEAHQSERPVEVLRKEAIEVLDQIELAQTDRNRLDQPPWPSIYRAVGRSLDLTLLEFLPDRPCGYNSHLLEEDLQVLLHNANRPYLQVLLRKGIRLEVAIAAFCKVSHGRPDIQAFILHDLGGSDFIVKEGIAYDDAFWKIDDKVLLAEFLRLQVARFPQHAHVAADEMLTIDSVDRFLALVLAGLSVEPHLEEEYAGLAGLLLRHLQSNHARLKTQGHLGALECYLNDMEIRALSLPALNP
jgi:hypothetical protein